MSQFEQIVTNITSESKKCNYNPEIGTNWDCLPMEMRNECVKWMDFKTRTLLSATSKTEKSLVGAKKVNQVRLYCGSSSGKWTFRPYSETFKDFKENVMDGFVSAMFKNCEIKNFWIKGVKYMGLINEHISQKNLVKFAPFRFKRLSVFRNENFYFFMKNCSNLEKVDFCNDYFGCYYKMLLDLPSVLNVKEFRFFASGVLDFMKFLIGLVQKWIDNDVEIGKSVQFVAKTEDTLNVFISKFADRIIEETDEIVCIRMNNKKSQILIRKIGSRTEWRRVLFNLLEDQFDYLSCKVVPIDMPESEYGKGDGWIQAIYEKGLKKDGKLENPVEFDAEDQAIWGEE